MKSFQSLFLFSALIAGTPASAATPECSAGSLWKAPYQAKTILVDDAATCRELCAMLEDLSPAIFCEKESGGRGYERSFVGNIVQKDALACIRFWPEGSYRSSSTQAQCYVRELIKKF